MTTDRAPTIRQMAEEFAYGAPASTEEGWYVRELTEFGQAVAARTREQDAQIAEGWGRTWLKREGAEVAAAIRASAGQEE